MTMTTLRKFFEELNGQADIWYKMARHCGQPESSNTASKKKTSKFERCTNWSRPGAAERHATTKTITNFMSIFMN